MNPLRILLVGIGGYGGLYVRDLAANAKEGNVTVAGVVDPYAQNAPEYETARTLTSAFFSSVEEFYAEHTADLAVISTPIPLHAPQAIYCMEHGSHVLVEKPIAATPDAARSMIAARDRTQKLLAVGFQWCNDRAMSAFRADAQAGRFGRLLSMRALVIWPRNTAYYTRGSGWAGKKYDRNGNPIFDSVASNATAHYLENMLWIAGHPLTHVQASTFRANPIETYDTITLTGRVGDAHLTYAATHAAPPDCVQNPMFEYEFERGTASFGGFGLSGSELAVRLTSGETVSYGPSFPSGGGSGRVEKLWDIVDSIREGTPLRCTAEDALLHTLAMESVREIEPDSRIFPEERIVHENGMYFVPGLAEEMIACYQERKLLSI